MEFIVRFLLFVVFVIPVAFIHIYVNEGISFKKEKKREFYEVLSFLISLISVVIMLVAIGDIVVSYFPSLMWQKLLLVLGLVTVFVASIFTHSRFLAVLYRGEENSKKLNFVVFLLSIIVGVYGVWLVSSEVTVLIVGTN